MKIEEVTIGYQNSLSITRNDYNIRKLIIVFVVDGVGGVGVGWYAEAVHITEVFGVVGDGVGCIAGADHFAEVSGSNGIGVGVTGIGVVDESVVIGNSENGHRFLHDHDSARHTVGSNIWRMQ